VYWRDAAWIHRYPGAKIPHASLGRAAPPKIFTAEAREVFLYGYVPRPGDNVFDVGAGIGAETLLFSRLVGPSGRVVSLEAHPRTYERLAQLCAVNRLGNVIPLQVAAADLDGELTLSDGEHYLQNTVVGAHVGGVKVPARRIESIARELDVRAIDFLKMNIEGFEQPALRGAGSLLARTRHVCISCHDFLGMATKEAVRDLLVEHGFDVRTREDAPEAWKRDYLYGERVNPAAKPAR
jgi:FkbM family methyltransferase